jgi:hypothetical protein
MDPIDLDYRKAAGIIAAAAALVAATWPLAGMLGVEPGTAYVLTIAGVLFRPALAFVYDMARGAE